MEYKLNIPQRIALLNILPFEGNVVTLRIIRELQNSLSFSESEMKQFNIKSHNNPDGTSFLTWDASFNVVTKQIEIGNVAHGIIAERLKEIESKKKLRMEMVELYEMFVEKKTS